MPDLQDLSPYLRIEDDTFINNAVLQSNNELVLSYNWQDWADVTVDLSWLITEGSNIYIDSAILDGNQLTLSYNNDVSPIVVDLPQQVFTDTFIGSVT